jgi:hypothetical protein
VSRTDRRALRAVAVQFFANGMVYATVIPRLPDIRERVDISIGALGLVLTLGSVASLIGSLLTGRAIARLGSRRVMIYGAVCSIGFLPVIGFSTVPVVLVAALFGLLFFDVFIDVAMNVQGSALSQRRHMPVMNRLHGLWSLGSVAGGVVTVLTLRIGVSTPMHLTGVALLLIGALAFVAPGLLHRDEAPELEEAARRHGRVGDRSERRPCCWASAVRWRWRSRSPTATGRRSVSARTSTHDRGSPAGVPHVHHRDDGRPTGRRLVAGATGSDEALPALGHPRRNRIGARDLGPGHGGLDRRVHDRRTRHVGALPAALRPCRPVSRTSGFRVRVDADRSTRRRPRRPARRRLARRHRRTRRRSGNGDRHRPRRAGGVPGHVPPDTARQRPRHRARPGTTPRGPSPDRNSA